MAGEGSALFIAVLLSSAQHHARHIMDIINVLDECPLGNLSEGLSPGACLQRTSASQLVSARASAGQVCVMGWGI